MGIFFSETLEENFKLAEFNFKERLNIEPYGKCSLMSHYLYKKFYVRKTILFNKGTK